MIAPICTKTVHKVDPKSTFESRRCRLGLLTTMALAMLMASDEVTGPVSRPHIVDEP